MGEATTNLSIGTSSEDFENLKISHIHLAFGHLVPVAPMAMAVVPVGRGFRGGNCTSSHFLSLIITVVSIHWLGKEREKKVVSKLAYY